jgi:predicted DNA-binding transcriptional regulator YafY
MKPAETKSTRLTQIELLLLDHPEGLPQADIARALGVHRSTILRNLADMDAPIYEDHGHLFIDRQAYLVNVHFTLHEALSVHLASRLLATTLDRQNPHAATALRKLGVALDRLAPHISRHLARSADAVVEGAQRQDPAYLKNLETLTVAWAEGRKVKLWYRPNKAEPENIHILSVYFIEPGAVGRSTYAFGPTEPDGEWRTYKIERILKTEILADTYLIQPGFEPLEMLAGAWSIWFTGNDPVEIILKFSQRVATRVGETRWHRSEQTTVQGDGSLLWRALIDEPQEMMPWIRSWGADVEVVAPAALRKVMAAEALRLYDVYSQSS